MQQSNNYSDIHRVITKIITKLKSNNGKFTNCPTIVPVKYIICDWNLLFNAAQEFNNRCGVLKICSCYCKEIPDGIIIIWDNCWIQYNCPACKHNNVFHILYVGNNNCITIMIYITRNLPLIAMYIY